MTAWNIALAGYLAFGQVIPSYQKEIVKHAGLQVIHADGAVTLRLKETGREETKTDGGRTLVIRLTDERYPFEVTRFVRSWNDCAAVETWVQIRHGESGPVKLIRADSFAAPVPVRASTVRVRSLSGDWGSEAHLRTADVSPGQAVQLLSRAGTRDAWESNAAMMVTFDRTITEEQGRVLGVALEWTGSTERRVHRNWNGRVTSIFAGVDMTTGPYTLDPGVTFETPKAILVWSEKGRGEVSRQYHRWARRHLMPHGDALHPVLLNSWEGAFFSFNEQTLLDMMDGVKEMGGEMFVLDDGWFGRGRYARNNDRSGLGDWVVNTDKLPRGLDWLSKEAHRRGLKFGLWIEPEMANTNSALAVTHPQWLLREEGRPLALGRGGTQLVLDMTNPAVRDNLFRQLDTLFASIPLLSYIKWDTNQNIVNPGSTYLPADRQPNLWYDYTKGLYELLTRLRAKRPDIMLQACASGGGHMDFGFLRHADEFWPSDKTDAYDRVFIQWGCSQFYPASAMACHVTASPNCHTRRRTPIKYRFDVAMTGRLGFELHPKKMSAEEVAFSKAAVAHYKRIRPIVQRGDLYRLVSPYEQPLASLMYVGDGSAVVFALGLKIRGTRLETLKLRALDPAVTYTVNEINRGERLHTPAAADGTLTATGRDLMEKGFAVRLSGDYDSAVFEVTPVKK
jgi:alpha-galactosidase